LPPLISEEPKHREYCTVGVRASSFSGFPTSSRKTPKELAIAGFYYRGFGDRTTCFHCGISLQGWSAEDDVLVEHVRNNPLCQYMRRLKGDDFVTLVMSVTQNQQVLVRCLNLFFLLKCLFLPNPVRIRVRIGPQHPLACRKRRLNGAVLRIRLEKPKWCVKADLAGSRPFIRQQSWAPSVHVHVGPNVAALHRQR
jgi:hypothetical protein